MTSYAFKFRKNLNTLSIVCSLVTVLFYAPFTWAQSSLGIAAVVNEDVISMLDLNSRITMIIETSRMNNSPEARSRIAHQVLRGLIDEKLKIQETRRVGIKVSQADIEGKLTQIAGSNKMNIPQLTNHLMSIGVPISSLTTRLEAEISWQKFVGRRLSKRIQVGAEEVKDEIARIQSNAGKPEYQLAEIYLPVDSPRQDSEVRATSERLVLQLRQGSSFSSLARNFSRSPSAAVNGDLGWVQLGNLDQSLQSALAQMKPGQASPPIRSLGGYYILLLRNVRTSPGIGQGDAMIKLSQYHVPLKNKDDPGERQNLAQRMSTATRTMTGCAQLEAAGAQTGSLMSGPLGEMKLSTLPKNIQSTLNTLRVGQPSAPVSTGGGLAVMMICERSDEAMNMDEVRKSIRTKLIESRLNVAAQRKLRDLHRDAFVDIRL